MSDESSWLHMGYQALAAVAGAVAALSFRPYEGMTRGKIALSLFVSATFAIFVGPLLIRMFYGPGDVDLRVAGAIMWGLATGSNASIPLFVKWVTGSLRVKAPGDMA